jgi:two-component sensor histidine kinase
MALLHDKLYQSDDLARIDFGQYINSLALDLRSSYGLSSRDVNLNIDVDSILLGVDTAIPCGVIVNELVANSLRHAFPGNRPGEISIRFCLADGQYMMVYKDDGVGFPDDLDIHNPSSMGLTIINALTGQLGGNIERGRKGGSDLIITFPAK